MRVVFLLAIQLIFAQSAYSAFYKNTEEEKQRFKQFIENGSGTVVCEAVKGYIYGNGLTIYLKPSQGIFLLSVFNNESAEWFVKDAKLALTPEISDDNVARFEDLDHLIDRYGFEMGVGEFRDLVSWIGDGQASSEFPYSGSFLHQFHNVCTIK